MGLHVLSTMIHPLFRNLLLYIENLYNISATESTPVHEKQSCILGMLYEKRKAKNH